MGIILTRAGESTWQMMSALGGLNEAIAGLSTPLGGFNAHWSHSGLAESFLTDAESTDLLRRYL